MICKHCWERFGLRVAVVWASGRDGRPGNWCHVGDDGRTCWIVCQQPPREPDTLAEPLEV